ncbi:MAG: aminotransferase class V-fold PLP-dependent enzyme, partial [Anaerolineales bacterium]|nr:aminotransferase class V-fold PLP-dependent enzyme [Anaerolineales bacterium]
MTSIKNLFLLDKDIVFLNHGSFGACPKPVFAEYQQWQLHLERQPVKFLGRDFTTLMNQTRHTLAAYLHTAAGNLAFVPNATHGVNVIARSLALKAGDEILTSDHEYGACNYIWEFNSSKMGAIYKKQPIPLPVNNSSEILEHFWKGVTPQTKVIFISHITSPTALRMPVEAICARARQQGILTIVDAAHSPGQIPLDLSELDADFVVGNCHKWMLAPKSAGFLYARPDVQHIIEPLVVSWGYDAPPNLQSGFPWIDLLEWRGTIDPSPFLTIPAAIQFMQDHDWENVRTASHNLLKDAIRRICALSSIPPLYPLESDLYAQMG